MVVAFCVTACAQTRQLFLLEETMEQTLATRKGGDLLEIGKAQKSRAFKQAWLSALSGDPLINVSRMARLAGIGSQTTMTQAAWLRYVSTTDLSDQPSRLYGLLLGLGFHKPVSGSEPQELILDHRMDEGGSVVRVTLKVASRRNSDASPPPLFLMLPEESLALM
jgi:hypothetical protein